MRKKYLRDYRPDENPWQPLPEGIEKIGRWYHVIGDPDNLSFLTCDVAVTHRDEIRKEQRVRQSNE